MRKLLEAASAATISLCLATGAAVAQEGTANGDDEIVVTAQRRSERIQDVPIAVSALSADYLAENNIRTLEDLTASTPSFVTTGNVGYGSAPLSIRGVGGANGGGNIFADEPVAVYVDQAFVSRLQFPTADLVDMAGVEIVRGPQGTLFGRNATAGALLIRSAEPTRDFEAFADVTYADPTQVRFQGAVSGPLSGDGRLMGRLALGYSDRDGWAHNSFNGETVNGSESLMARARLRFEPTETLRFDLIAESLASESGHANIAIADVFGQSTAGDLTDGFRFENTNPGGANEPTVVLDAIPPTNNNSVYPYVRRPGLDALIESDTYALDTPNITDTESNNLTLTANWDLGAIVFDYVGNYREWWVDGMQDSDGTAADPPAAVAFITPGPQNLVGIGFNDRSSYDNQSSHEFRLSSDTDGRLSWIVGAYLFNESNEVSPIRIYNNLAFGGAGQIITFNAQQDVEAWALFADATFDITAALSLTLGARYSHEEKDFSSTQTIAVRPGFTFDPPGPAIFTGVTSNLSTGALSASFDDLSPRAVLNFQPSEDLLLYASYSQGFKSGGFNAFSASPASVAFEPEEIDAYEIGIKSDWFNRALRLNLAAFHYDYENLQVRVPVVAGGVGIETADAASVDGAEIELTWQATQNFSLSANVSWLDGVFDAGQIHAVCGGLAQVTPDFGAQACGSAYNLSTFLVAPGAAPQASPGAPVVVGLEDLSGNRMARSPEWQYSITGRYEWPTAIGDVTASVTYRGQTEVYFLETQQQASTFSEDAWGTVDARMSLSAPGDRWEFALFGQNLTDERHFTQITAFFGLPNGVVNDPRTIGAQLRLRY